MDEHSTEGDNSAYINNDNTTVSQELSETFNRNTVYELQIQ